ncbi:MAG TPA: EAL domain-containing protein [Gammaproteobacteria bacterium]|nr:EAL domain-containing protein [Gammaproteobacteria bacterium]
MKHGEILHLLIIEESKNDAESLANALRNNGHQIQFNHGTTLDDIEIALKNQHPDIVLCGSGTAIPPASEVTTLLGRHELTVPVIVIAEEASESEMVAARKSGISSLISYDQPDHLPLVFSREVDLLRLQQQLNALNGALRGSESRCHALIENSSDAVAYIHEGMHVYANQPYMDLFAIENREEVEGTPILDMISETHRDSFKGFLKDYLEEQAEDNNLDIACLNPAGEVFHSSMELSPATMEGEPCTQIIIRVKASNAELEKKIESLSRLDSLTGLSNRQHFMQLLKERISEQNTTDDHRALIYITLDNFKVIREEYGIVTSDTVLCDIAELLEANCGENDCLSRFGDYSFAILHYDSNEEKTLALGETLLHKIAGHLSEVNGRAITTTSSIGTCTIKNSSNDAQQIISWADMACEVARSSGGNQIHTHSVVVSEQIGQENEQAWDDVIRSTIDEERFHLAYQPIVSLKGDTRQRYEVLLRIIDEAGHVILPGQFLSIAEKTGLSGEIDRRIISTAFRKLAETRKDNDDTSFYIKLSGTTLTDTGLPAWIEEQLRENHLVSDGIVFEIPERTAIDDLKSAMTFVKSMQNLNYKVAFEHYGHSDQPQLLKHLPVDILKIDGALISGLAGNEENKSRVKAIIELAKEHGKVCIAECVDDAGSLAQLWQYGVDFIQGNFVQEPSKELNYDFEGEIA